MHAGDTEDLVSSSVLEFVNSVLMEFSFEVQTSLRFELYSVAAIGEAEVCGGNLWYA